MSSEEKVIEIFYADDQKVDQLLFKLALSEITTPAHLKTANDGREAIEVLINSDGYVPDLIFLDLKMPLKDGNECLEEIRKIEKFNLTPVIIFSNSTQERDVEKAYQNNANLYVQKPFDINEQIELMKKLFSLDWKEYFPHPPQENFVLKIG